MLFAGGDISKRFAGGAVSALAGVSLQVDPGTVHLLLGENGAGKTTLFNILAGDLEADSGSFNYPEDERSPRPPAAVMPLAYVRQEPRYAPRLRVWEHLLLGHETRLLAATVGPGDAVETLEAAGLSGLPGITPERRMGSLSPGERYLVSLAAGVSCSPRLVILDEPFAPCTPGEAALLVRLIDELRRHDASVLLASHRIREAMEIADRLTVLSRGRVTLEAPRGGTSLEAVYEAMFPEREDEQQATPGAGTASPVGDTPSPARSPLIHFGDTRLEDAQGRLVDFGDVAIAPGQRLAILSKDPKLLRSAEDLLGGFAIGERGHLLVEGAMVRNPSPRLLRRHGVRYVPRDRDRRSLALEYSIRENLTVPLPQADHATALEGVEDEVGMTAGVDAPVSTLSGGNRSRLVIFRETRGAVRLLVLVRPAAGLDRRAVIRLARQLEELCAGGAAVLVLSSDPEEVLALSPVVRVVSGGTLSSPMDTGSLSEALLMEQLAR